MSTTTTYVLQTYNRLHSGWGDVISTTDEETARACYETWALVADGWPWPALDAVRLITRVATTTVLETITRDTGS